MKPFNEEPKGTKRIGKIFIEAASEESYRFQSKYVRGKINQGKE